MAEKVTRYSFAEAAAQQPERQRFSFSAAAPQKNVTEQQREAIANIPLPDFSTANSTQAVMLDRPTGGKLVIPAVAKTVYQESIKDLVGVAKTAADTLSGTPTTRGEVELGGINKWLYGAESTSLAKQSEGILTPFGVSKEREELISPILVGGLVLSDFIPGSSGARRFIKEGLAAKTLREAAAVLRSAGATDDIIFGLKLDRKLAQATTESAVESVLKEAAQAVKQSNISTPTAGITKKFSFSDAAKQTPNPTLTPRTIDGSPVTPARVPTPTQTPTAPGRFSFAETARQTPTAPAARQVTPTPTSATPTTRTDITRSKIEADLDEARFIEGQVMPKRTTDVTKPSVKTPLGRPVNNAPKGTTFVKDKVVQVTEPGDKVRIFRVPEQDFDEVKRLIDDGRTSDTPIAMGLPTGDRVYHITAKTPEQMLSKDNVIDGGFVTADDIAKVSQEFSNKTTSPKVTQKPTTPTQTANAERAEQIIKRQPKPEEVAKDVSETKKWESDPVKAQAEATSEVATKYSNTVADKGFISEGAAKIDGVPPVKNVRAKARNFAKDNDVPIDLPPQTWAGYFITQVQDTAYRLGLVQKQLTKAGVKISDDANAYLQREAYIGRAASKIEKKRKELGMVAGNKNGLFMRMRRDNITIEGLDEYMRAKAAADRNKRVASLKDGIPDGGSGLTNAEAAEILAKYKGNTKIEAYAKEFRDTVITPRLQLLREAGILTDEQIANITKYEPNYVPFKVAEFDRIQGGGKGFSVKGSSVKGLRGSARKDRTNSVMQAVADYEDAVQRAEKNKSLQAMGKLIEENPDKTLWEVKGVQYVPQYDEVGELQFLRQRPINEKTSVEFFKDGKAYEIRFHDKALAKVFTQEGMWKPIAALRVINNYLRAVNTVINPEFMITNAMRDAQTALVIAGGEKGMLTAAKTAKDYPAAAKGIWQAVRKESNTGWAKTYNEMVEAGGRTGWFDLKEVSESTKEVSKLVNRYNSTKTSDSLMRAVDSTAKLISDVNEVGEMAVRVSVYKQLVDAGMTKVQAANYAKNMTVNFNKRGNIGMFANSLYLFANAGIQSIARLLMAMKNPKVRRITYGIVGSSYAINELNNKINPEGYERIQDFEKERNLIIMLPLDGNKYNIPGVSGDPSNGYYFKVPLPYGFNVFKVAGDAAYDVVHGRKTSGEAMKQMLLSIDASFNPLSSGTPTQFISPTVSDPFVASWENKNWFGAPIMPDQPAFAPAVRDSDRYFSGARDISVETAQFLNRLTGGNEVTAGAVDISPETIDHVIDFLGGGLGNFLGQSVDGTINVVKGDLPAPEEMPFVRKFIDTPFEKGEQMQAFQLLEQSATKPLNQIQTDRFIDAVIEATVRGDMTVETGERMFTQYQQNVARNYAGEILSLFNENKLDEALELYQSTPTQVKKELDKFIEDDFERELKRQE